MIQIEELIRAIQGLQKIAERNTEMIQMVVEKQNEFEKRLEKLEQDRLSKMTMNGTIF